MASWQCVGCSMRVDGVWSAGSLMCVRCVGEWVEVWWEEAMVQLNVHH